MGISLKDSAVAYEWRKLTLSGITKSYGGVVALRPLAAEFCGAEIIGVAGENGSGKSSLARIIAGALFPTAGSIVIDGREVRFFHPSDAARYGIRLIPQGLGLCDDISALNNLFLGHEPCSSKFGVVDIRTMRRLAVDVLSQLGYDPFPIDRNASALSGGQRQALAIARALIVRPRLVIFDEPTAALAPRETKSFFDLVENLKKRGVCVIVISHNIGELWRISERLIVLRRGTKVTDVSRGELTEGQLLSLVASVSDKSPEESE